MTDIELHVDPYTLYASKLFEVLYEEVTTEQRNSAKSLMFGIMYGMTKESLNDKTEKEVQ